MDAFKQEWEDRTKLTWQHQTNEVENEYKKFITEQKPKDQYLMRDVTEEKTVVGVQDYLKDAFKKKKWASEEEFVSYTNISYLWLKNYSSPQLTAGKKELFNFG